MDETIKLQNAIVKRLEELKLFEYKYYVLTEFVKNEATSEIYFDKSKILKMIDILEMKPVEDVKSKENIGEENE